MTSSNGIILRVTGPLHKCQWRGALMFSLLYAWTNGWANNRDTGDFRPNRDHYQGKGSGAPAQPPLPTAGDTDQEIVGCYSVAVWAPFRYKDSLSRYTNFHRKEKTETVLSFNGNSYTGKTPSLCWDGLEIIKGTYIVCYKHLTNHVWIAPGWNNAFWTPRSPFTMAD